ncbi:MAG: PAS domain-containing protein [Candidatus Methanomethylophilaceae archaeon]|nr:PAS domain-containing protein [Candidatus Methanomethylophilaceae archaeon]
MGRNEQDVYTEKLMNMILDLVDDIIIIHDSEHTVVWMNRAGEKAFDRSIDDVIGMKCYELFDNSMACADCVVKSSIGGPSNTSKRRVIPKTGVQCDCSAVPYYENGSLKFVVQHLIPVSPIVPSRRGRPENQFYTTMDMAEHGSFNLRFHMLHHSRGHLFRRLGDRRKEEEILPVSLIRGSNMVTMPEPVLRMVVHPETNKTMSTVSPQGEPHCIVCGSLAAIDSDKICVGDVYMYRTGENLAANPLAEFLVWRGREAYSLKAKVVDRLDSGPVFEKVQKTLEKMQMKIECVWVFEVLEIWDEGIGNLTGAQIA